MTDTVKDRILSIIAEEADMDRGALRMDMTLDDLGVDSLGLVESIFKIEEAFDISIPFNANEPSQSDFDISSLATIVAGVERLVAARG